MTDVLDSLDTLADEAAGRICLLPLGEARRRRRRHRRRLRAAAGAAAVVVACVVTAALVVSRHATTVPVEVSRGPTTTPTISPLPDAAARADIVDEAEGRTAPQVTESQLAVPVKLRGIWIKKVTYSTFLTQRGLDGSARPIGYPGPEYPAPDLPVYVVLEQGQFTYNSEIKPSVSSWLEEVRLTVPPLHIIDQTGWNATTLPGWFVALKDLG